MINKILFVLLIFGSCIYALQQGSDTAVAREANIIFPANENDTNSLYGFSAFENGFTLENLVTECQFNAFFPVSGQVALNGGRLNLVEDLVFSYGVDLSSGGLFNGASHAIVFDAAEDLILQATGGSSIPDYWLSLLLQNTRGGQVVTADWAYDDQYVLSGALTDQLTVLLFETTPSFTVMDTVNVGAQLNDALWHPTDYYIAVGTNTSATVNELQVYYYNTSTQALSLNASVAQPSNVLSVAWHPSGNYLLVTRSASPRLVVYSFSPGSLTEIDTDTGPNTTLNPRTASWNADGSYFVVSTIRYNRGGEIYIYTFNGTTIGGSVASANPNRSVLSVDWIKTGNFIAAGLNGSTTRLRLYQFTAPATLTQVATVSISQNVNSLHWAPDGLHLLVGLASGGGTEFQLYEFDDTGPTLTLVNGLQATGNVLRGRFSRDGCYAVRGDSLNEVGVYAVCTGAGGLNFAFQNVALKFNSNVYLNSPAIFSGTCNWYGSDCVLTLGIDGEIIIEDAATLLLENVTVENISADKIRCEGSASKLVLLNATMSLSDDAIFAEGSLEIAGNTKMMGGHVFSYQSAQQSIIDSRATWFFDSGMTFDYAPAGGAYDRIAFADVYAQIQFFETSITVPSTGLRFTKGTIVVDGECPVNNNAVSESGGLWFGDGVSSVNDVRLKLLPGSGLTVDSGYVVYNNVA